MAFTWGMDFFLVGPWLSWMALAAGTWAAAAVPWERAAAVAAVTAVADGTCMFVGKAVSRYSNYALHCIVVIVVCSLS